MKLRNWLGHNEAQEIDEEETKILTCLAHKSMSGLAKAASRLNLLDAEFRRRQQLIKKLIGDDKTCKVKWCEELSVKEIHDKLPDYPIDSFRFFKKSN